MEWNLLLIGAIQALFMGHHKMVRCINLLIKEIHEQVYQIQMEKELGLRLLNKIQMLQIQFMLDLMKFLKVQLKAVIGNKFQILKGTH